MTQTRANELHNITVIAKSDSDKSNNKPASVDLKQIQRRLEYLMGGDAKPPSTADELNKLKSDVRILCQTREAMEDNLAETQLECNKLRTENKSLTHDATHVRDLLHKTKEFGERQQSLYGAKLKERDNIIDKLQQQIDTLTQVNASLHSKYHDVTTEHLELKQEN
jgi:chromosome segregation ATPase